MLRQLGGLQTIMAWLQDGMYTFLRVKGISLERNPYSPSANEVYRLQMAPVGAQIRYADGPPGRAGLPATHPAWPGSSARPGDPLIFTAHGVWP